MVFNDDNVEEMKSPNESKNMRQVQIISLSFLILFLELLCFYTTVEETFYQKDLTSTDVIC